MSKPFKNFFLSSKTSSADEKNETITLPSTPSNNTALCAILGGLKHYHDDAHNNKASSKYNSTATLYDVVIRIGSLNDLCTTGWEILVGKHTKHVVPKKTKTENNPSGKTSDESNEGVVVTVLGAYNRGKSFLLKKLCRIELPNGNLVHTEGISITAGRDNYKDIAFLDTAGTDTPVKNEDIDFKRATDALLREVVLHLSNFFIVVVNRLRATDQIYIQQILKYCRTNQNKKNIIIVHNLLDVETIEDINDIITKEIKNVFGATEKEVQLTANGTTRPIQFFISKQNDGIELRHYVLAKSSSKAGELWNRQTLDGIMNLLQNSDNKRSLNIIKDMISYINNKLPQLFQVNNDSRDCATQPVLQVVEHENQPYIVLVDRKHRSKLSEEPFKLKLSDKLVYDDAGYFVRNETGQWQPRYNLYEHETKYCLIVELAGLKDEIKVDILEKSITLEGTRSDLNASMSYPITRQADILIGSFKMNIPFDYEIDQSETEAKCENGLLKIILPKKKPKQTRLKIQ